MITDYPKKKKGSITLKKKKDRRKFNEIEIIDIGPFFKSVVGLSIKTISSWAIFFKVLLDLVLKQHQAGPF